MRVFFMAFLTLISYQTLGQVQEFRLDNGLKILVKEDHRSPIVVSMLWYNVGSADEPGGVTGVSHALEHLMFKGTPKFPLGVFSKTISNVGGQENAFTSTDYTTYFEKIAASNLAIAFELEADRMQNLQFEPNEFQKEMKVIQEERRLRTDDNPQALTFERFSATANLTAPYQHPVIGWMGDLQQMQIHDAKTWYNEYYAPNNATLVVIGDVTVSAVRDLAQRYFGHLTPRPQKIRKRQVEPKVLGSKQILVHAPAQVPAILMGYTVPSVKTSLEKSSDIKPLEPYALEVIAGILDAGESSRFNERLVRGRHIASSIAVQYNIYSRYQSQFIIYGTPEQSHTIDNLRQEILNEIHRLQKEPITDAELNRVKTQIIAEKTFERDSVFTQAMEIGLLETIGLGWQTAELYVERINQVTAKDIQDAAQQYFKRDSLTEALLIPSKPSNSSGKAA
jgi:zinc protease